MTTLESVLKELLPARLREFKKLTEGEPYRFKTWKVDGEGRPCLYYTFSSRDGRSTNTKRVPMAEIGAALTHLRETGHLRRKEFRDVCPVAERDGGCAFAVVGRILEALGAAQYVGADFFLTDPAKADSLLR
jgi:hypothetical protein